MTRSFWHEVRHELLPFPGRMATAWRLGVICSLTALAFMTWQIPLVAIGCYLVLFVMKPDPGESTLMAIAISILVSVIVALLLWLTQLSINVPSLRLIILAASSFLFLYLGSASKLGPVGSIIALVIAFIMTLLGSAPFGEVVTRGILYAWLMALIPMALLVISSALFGQSVPRLLHAELERRLAIVTGVTDGTLAADAALSVLRQGNAPINSYLKFISLFHLLPSNEGLRLRNHHERILQMLLVIASHASADPRTGGAQVTDTTDALKHALSDIRSKIDTPVPPGPQSLASGFFRADALTSPRHYRFALKTTLAASLAYIIYTALDWQDIHTAMVTCYVAALGSTGETLHKLTLRIIGCLIGAAMGVASILLLMPLMTSIGELMILVFAGTMVAGWVSSGSERIAYAGVQIGLAFLMTVLQGFGPDVELSVAMDRVIGILLGNALLYVIFTRIWPVSSTSTARAALHDVKAQLQALRINAVPGQVLAPSQAAELLTALNQASEQLQLQHFEPGPQKVDLSEHAQLRQMLQATEARCIVAALDPAWEPCLPEETDSPRSPAAPPSSPATP